jgi:ABC-type nitrate/sulfonate/bicarbonate transport system substrate-binding protein
VAALTVVAGACSGADDSAGASGSEGSSDSPAPKELTEVKYGIPWTGAPGTTPSDVGPLGYAVSLGLAEPIFAEYGFELTETVAFTNGPPTIEALHAGSVQVVQAGDIPVLAAQASGKDAVPIQVAEPYLDAYFLSRKGGPTSIEDLAGKKVGLQFGSNFDKYGRSVLSDAGVIDDVELVNLPFTDALPALQRGDVDGYAIIGNIAGTWLAKNPDLTVLDKASDGDGSGLSTSIAIVTPAFHEEHPDFGEAWWKVYRAGVAAIEDDTEAYLEWVSATNGTPLEVVKDTTLLSFGDAPVTDKGIATLEADLAFSVEAGTAPKSFDVEQWTSTGEAP